jgi:dienelactone hydrolase
MAYDPFLRGPFPVGVRTIEALDTKRHRLFPCEIWYPAETTHSGDNTAHPTDDWYSVPFREGSRRQSAVRNAAALPGTYSLVVFSHHSGGHRRAATYLSTHLSSHGYMVAALDHSEVTAPELARKDGETEEQRAARADGWIANRVPDIRFLLDHLLNGTPWDPAVRLEAARIGIVGHSFGGWTALAAAEEDLRIGAVVALAPGGNSKPKPGILPLKLSFRWGRDVPTLYLAAENDTPIPLPGIYELFDRTPATKQLVILRRADHLHFMDNVEEEHEAMRNAPFSGALAWIPSAMLPITDLCSGKQAHLFVRGLTLSHMDASLRDQEEARLFLAGDVGVELANRGVEALVYRP